MEQGHHHWLTVHRIRFAEEISANDRVFETPEIADCWRFCPSQRLSDQNLPSWRSDSWGGFGIYSGRESAEQILTDPHAHLPFLAEAVEHWHALLLPFMHKGEVNWRGHVENGSAIEVGADPERGQLAVITSAGFNSRDPDQIPRISHFLDGVEKVVQFFGELDDNVRRDVFNGGFDLKDGFTLSIWPDDAAMMQAAYRSGTHRSLMDESRDGSMFDRSSFTRARFIATAGTWDGAAVPA